ncbi:hypothetical protein [Pseudooceanicola sp. MF1-13]|uniref:DUF7936 family protein n=1 Tax=Pseudooceanicola sp. MF1-13 TaxID=3379095 RepID=UPI003892087F
MSVQITWSLRADVQAEMIVSVPVEGGADGETQDLTFSNVVTSVHWDVVADDGNDHVRIYGEQHIPAPTDHDSYIDLSDLQDMDADTRHQTILGWAEAIAPGFVDEQEAKVTQALADKIAAPSVTTVSII